MEENSPVGGATPPDYASGFGNGNFDPYEYTQEFYAYQAQQAKEQEISLKLKDSLSLSQGVPREQNLNRPEFRRLILTPDTEPIEREEVLAVLNSLVAAINLRHKYVTDDYETLMTHTLHARDHPSDAVDSVTLLASQEITDEEMTPAEFSYKFVDGVAQVWSSKTAMENNEAPQFKSKVPELREYYSDLNTLLRIANEGPNKTYCYERLALLESCFVLHKTLNQDKEKLHQMNVAHRDFYNIRKVDTHIHLSSAMNQKHLLKFIKKKLKSESNEVVIFRDNKHLSLQEVFESIRLTAYDLTVDRLDVHADNRIFHRFDKFNLKYNPIGESRLREIFLKTDNLIKGRYLAEMTYELMEELKDSKYILAEYRVSIYGRKRDEWSKLAAWVCDNNLFSDHVRWLVQVPRLYEEFKKNRIPNFETMQDMVSNIFEPLFEVTLDPSKDPKLHRFLRYLVGVDCVDDESKLEHRLMRKYPPPLEWNLPHNPPYSYYLYYLYSNLDVLNRLRRARGFSTFKFRPHSGEAGELDHLAAAFLLADGINHGINLRKTPVLQYLFYLCQIGIAMSPLSNNSLFLNYSKNPFPQFFARGLNVSLSTDDPLQFHYTREPLIEEYAIAAQVWKMTSADLCEVGRYSVLQSGFEHNLKMQWLGANYFLPGISGNDLSKTNVPNIRVQYRHQTLLEEMKAIFDGLKSFDHIDLSYVVHQLKYSIDDSLRKSVREYESARRKSGDSFVLRTLSSPDVNKNK